MHNYRTIMNCLAIDLGDKTCGLAYNIMGIIFTLSCVPRFKLVGELKKIIQEKNIDTLVIGLPYDLYGTDLKQFQKTNQFIKKVKNIFPLLNIQEIDERFTTFEAIRILEQSEKKENILKKKDSMSAYLILETYLNKIKNQ